MSTSSETLMVNTTRTGFFPNIFQRQLEPAVNATLALVVPRAFAALLAKGSRKALCGAPSDVCHFR